MKEVTVEKYLKEQLQGNKYLKILIKNYCLDKVSIEKFFKYFQIEKDPKVVADYIMDGNNCFELSMVGHRLSGEDQIYANKKTDVFGGKTTAFSYYDESNKKR